MQKPTPCRKGKTDMPILSLEMLQEMAPPLRSKAGAAVGKFLLNALEVQSLNDVNDTYAALNPPDFALKVLQSGGITDYKVGNASRLDALPRDGAFITISNHPYGGVDGIMLLDLFGHLRPDYKVLVNKFLSYIKPMDPSFITVIPKTDDSSGVDRESIQGIKNAISHLRDGHPLGIFPSGAVSDLHYKDFKIYDREWQEPILRLIRKARVPILPVRFFGRNSMLFYLLGLVNWRIRTLRLPHEILNKEGVPTMIGIGEIISPEEQSGYDDIGEFGKLLRSRVYGMEKPEIFTSRSRISFRK